MVTGSPRSNNSLLIVTVVVIAATVLICGPLLMSAVQSFVRFGAKSKQGEAKANLKAVLLAEQAWFSTNHTYSESLEEVGFIPLPGNRYRYVLALDGGVLEPRSPPDGGMHSGVAVDQSTVPRLNDATLLKAIPASLLEEVGVRGSCPTACRMTVVAVGDIDVDSTADVWSISTDARVIGRKTIPASTPYNHVNDVTD